MAKQRHSWPLEKAIETAKLFNSRSELFRSYPGAYMALKKAKLPDGTRWIDKLLPKIPRKRQWSIQAIKTLCLEHGITDRRGLGIQAPTALRTAYRHGWIAKLFPTDHGR